MDLTKRLGLLLIGVVIGIVATTVVGSEAKQQQPDRRRLSMTMEESAQIPNGTINQIGFIKDRRSGGCWIVILKGDHGAGVAPAPAPACE